VESSSVGFGLYLRGCVVNKLLVDKERIGRNVECSSDLGDERIRGVFIDI